MNRAGRARCLEHDALPIPLAILALFLWVVPVFGQDNAQNLPPYTINPGDLLEVSVWKEIDLQREVLVRPDGAFSFPLSGDIVAVGRTVEDIRMELSERLETYIPGLFVTVTVARLAAILVGFFVYDSAVVSIMFFSAVSVVFSGVFFAMAYSFAKRHDEALYSEPQEMA